VLADEAARAEPSARPPPVASAWPRAKGVALRQRLWPMVDMLKRAAAAGEPVVWGV
jgi:hypothetical protein